jgi:glycolate oxidase FAD binding subunit
MTANGAASGRQPMSDLVLAALTAACPATRPAAAEAAVAGVTPRYTASPATTSEASALMRAAAEHDLALVPRGGGSKLDWGVPPRRCDLVVDTGSLNQVTEHAAGDLVARVQAGVRIQHLAEVLARAGQQLALDLPPTAPGGGAAGNGMAGGGAALPERATIGGALATAAAGPRRLRYGTPRDLVIGITVVRADGTVAHSGGKVVKNVAGYDLGKLFAGSYGTLGLIVEAVFRLHPIPAGVAYVTSACPDVAAVYRAVSAAVDSQLSPSAVEIDRRARGQPVRVGVLLEGDPDGVRERAELMRHLLGAGADTSPSAPAWWGWPAEGAPRPSGTGTLIKIGFWAAALPSVLAAIDGAAAETGLDPAVGGSAAAGVIYAAVGGEADPAEIAKFVSALRGALADADGGARPSDAPQSDSPRLLASAVVVHCPPSVHDLIDPWGPVPSLGLMRAVKDQFDPGHRMAPGRFAGGL